MTIATRAKDVGGVILGLVVVVGILAIGIALLTGAAEFSVWVLEMDLSGVLDHFSRLPSSFDPPCAYSSNKTLCCYWIYDRVLCLRSDPLIWGMAYTYSVWGLFAVVVGLVFFGIGVVPIAMFAALVHGDWGNLAVFIAAAVLTYGFRGLAYWLEAKASERAARLDEFVANPDLRSPATVQHLAAARTGHHIQGCSATALNFIFADRPSRGAGEAGPRPDVDRGADSAGRSAQS